MFIDNKYTTWYYNIINAASQRAVEGYVERHHIIPKCLGGSNQKSNIVALTAKEHYICHQLLVRMVVKEHKSRMALAATSMWRKGNNQQRDYKKSSRSYDRLKKQASEFLSELNRRRWADPEQRSKMGARKGPNPNNIRHIVHTDESKEKMRQKRLEYWAQKKGPKPTGSESVYI